MALTDADLAVIQRDGASESQRPISISVHKERAQKFNTVKATIYDPAQDYKQSALTPLVGAALLARDGVELVQAVTMPAVNYAPQALHVAGIIMRDARDPLVVELPFKLRAYPLELFDTVSLTLSRYGWTAKTFMILGRQWASDGSIVLTLKETTAAIVTLDAGFAAQGFAANTALPTPWLVYPPSPLTLPPARQNSCANKTAPSSAACASAGRKSATPPCARPAASSCSSKTSPAPALGPACWCPATKPKPSPPRCKTTPPTSCAPAPAPPWP
jgi:hypothetical protein